MRTITALPILLRHLRVERGAMLTLLAVLTLTVFVAAAIPRLYNQMLDDELAFRVAEAPADWRNISVTMNRQPEVAPGEAFFPPLVEAGGAYLQEMDPVLQEIISGYSETAQSQLSGFQQMRYQEVVPFTRALGFRAQDGVMEHVRLVEGRMPASRGRVLLSEITATPGARGEQPYPRVEVLLTATTTEDLAVGVGDWSKLLLFGSSNQRALVQVVGIIEVLDPTDTYWNANERLFEPVVSGFATDFSEVVEGIGLVDPAAVSDLVAAGPSILWQYTWVYYVDPERFHTGNYQAVASEILALKISLGAIEELRGAAPQLTVHRLAAPVVSNRELEGTYLFKGALPEAPRRTSKRYTDPPPEKRSSQDRVPLSRPLGIWRSFAEPQEALLKYVSPSQQQWPLTQYAIPISIAVADNATLHQVVAAQPIGIEPAVVNELPLVLERFSGQARLTAAVVAVTAIGMLATGLVTLGLLAALIAERRQSMLTLIRGRGATGPQLLAAQFVEGLLVGLPGVLLGLGLAYLLVDSRPNPWSLRAAVAVGGFTVLLLLVAARVNILAQLGALLARRDGGLSRLTLRRTVFEGLVVLLAAVGIFLLRRRGLASAETLDDGGSFDPFLAAVPVLLVVAVGIVSLRLFPLPVQLIAWIARWGRGLVLFVGLRRTAERTMAANLPLFVMLLAVGVAVFGSVVFRSVNAAQDAFAWQEVRADYRIDANFAFTTALPGGLDLGAAEGVEIAADEFKSTGASLLDPERDRAMPNVRDFTVIGLETEAYQEIVAGTVLERQYPAALSDSRGGANIGNPENPVPAVVSALWPDRAGDAPGPGDTITLSVSAPQLSRSVPVAFEIAGSQAEQPGINPNTPFVIAGWEDLTAALNLGTPRPIRPTTIYIGAVGASEEGLRETIREQSITSGMQAVDITNPIGISITSRAERYEALTGAPLARGLVESFRLSVALGAIYAGFSVIVALTLSAHARARDLGFMRTLGLTGRQAFWLTLIEHVPAAFVASGIGVVLGIAIARLIEPGIDLTAFAGPGIPVAMVSDWPVIALVAAGLAVIALLAILIASLAARRTSLGQVLRIGE